MKSLAVTVLKNLKESPRRPSKHLQNCIRYILNTEKTEDGLWVGGNVGREANEVYQAMLDTKMDWQKSFGRQGYHFVISFQPGEVSEETAYEVGKDFCARYLGDHYDYVFAVHNDHAHMHCHIVFNSVDRLDGHKYRYIDGDWEKSIQPITDAICKEYGLSELVYDRGERKGVSYAEHMARKEGKVNNTMIIRADIDFAIQKSRNWKDYMQEMKSMGYQLRIGNSVKYGEYVSYLAPGADNARRDYRIGTGYRVQDILKRINTKAPSLDPPVFLEWKLPVVQNLSRLQACAIERVHQALHYREYDQRIIDQVRVRRDLLKIDRLQEECVYLLKSKLTNIPEVEKQLSDVNGQIFMLQKIKETNQNKEQVWDSKERSLRETYKKLMRQLEEGRESLSDKVFEKLEDKLEVFGQTHPGILLEEKKLDYQMEIKQLCHQKRVLSRILKDAKETMRVVPVYNSLPVRRHIRKQ